LPGRETLALVDRCNDELVTYLETHEENNDDEHGRVGPGGPLPTREAAIAAHRRYRPHATLDKLAACRSSILIDRPSGGRMEDGTLVDVSPLQAAILKFLLARIGDGLVMFNDYPLVGSRMTLLDLRWHAPDFPA
jgi:hypothetical protein